jgi:uncharacterized protein YcsI (UPF0317 family)
MVVSMRPYRKEDAEKVCAITGEFPAAHGTSAFGIAVNTFFELNCLKDWT